jgi:riboflavin kinase / FMN adenylyltransferase
VRIVAGLDALEAAGSPAFVVVGVFDGLHLGHAYLLEHLVREAAARSARPVVITFDHHPDEVLTGNAPPLLCDPDERIERLAAAGVETTVVVHFDQALRETPYDRFVDRLEAGTSVAGFLMTPDAAFGYERAGTPATLEALGATRGWDVVVVPAFEVDGRPVRSTQIRSAIADGDLGAASRLMGRPHAVVGEAAGAGEGAGEGSALRFALPVALPPDGRYAVRVGRGSPDLAGAGDDEGEPAEAEVAGGALTVAGPARIGRTRVAFTARR